MLTRQECSEGKFQLHLETKTSRESVLKDCTTCRVVVPCSVESGDKQGWMLFALQDVGFIQPEFRFHYWSNRMSTKPIISDKIKTQMTRYLPKL